MGKVDGKKCACILVCIFVYVCLMYMYIIYTLHVQCICMYTSHVRYLDADGLTDKMKILVLEKV